MDASSAPSLSGIGRIILGSFLSTLAGWATLAVIPLGASLLWTNDSLAAGLANSFVTVVFAGVFIVPVWLCVLLPLYYFVPSHSGLWHWPVCTFCGAAAGGVIMLAFCAAASGALANNLPLVGLAALVGATTCLFGTLTRRWFRFPDEGLKPEPAVRR